MAQILVENHVRKRTRLIKDARFVRLFEINGAALKAQTVEQFVDAIADAYDPTYVGPNAQNGSEFLDYIINNIYKGSIAITPADAAKTKNVLAHYREELSNNAPRKIKAADGTERETARVEKELERYYPDISQLEVHLTEINKYDRIALINDPNFQRLYNDSKALMAGGYNTTADQFYNYVQAEFDPTPDGIYMPYILSNLNPRKDAKTGKELPHNVNLADASEVKYLLNTHFKAVQSGVKKIHRNVMRFYPNIFPDLQNAMEALGDKYDFADNKHPSLAITERLFTGALGEPMYKTDTHLFYYVKDMTDCQKVLTTRGDEDYPQFSRHCSGFWCLPYAGNSYFPCALTVNRYGFCDYAIVPKDDGSGYDSPELKNRFNYSYSCSVMNEKDYNSIFDFLTNCKDERMAKISGIFKNNARVNLNSLSDFTQFLLRSRTLDDVNKLTKQTFLSDNEFFLWVGRHHDTIDKPETFTRNALSQVQSLRNNLLAKWSNKFPLLKPFVKGDTATLVDTPLDPRFLSKQIFQSIITKLKAIVNMFIKQPDTNIFEGDTNILTKIVSEYTDLQKLQQVDPAKTAAIGEQFIKKIHDGTIGFPPYIGEDEMNKFGIAYSALWTSAQKPLKDALQKSFEMHIKTSNVLNNLFRDDEYIKVNTLLTLKLLLDNKIPPAATEKLLPKVAYGIVQYVAQNPANASSVGIYHNFTANIGATELNTAVALIKATEKFLANNVISQPSLTHIYKAVKKVVDGYPRKINATAPRFMRSIAYNIPNTVASRLYPNAVKLYSKYLSKEQQISYWKQIVSNNNTDLLRGNEPLRLSTLDDPERTVTISAATLAGRSNASTLIDINDSERVVDFFQKLYLIGINDRTRARRSYTSINASSAESIRLALHTLAAEYDFAPTRLLISPFSGMTMTTKEHAMRLFSASKTLSSLTFVLYGKLKTGHVIAIDTYANIITSTRTGELYKATIGGFTGQMKTLKFNENYTASIPDKFGQLLERANLITKLDK